MSGTALSLFADFVALTGPTYFRGPKDIVNDAQKTNYATLGYMLRGQGMSDVLQGGSEIKDFIYLNAIRRARSYKPNQKQSYENPQTGVTWTVPWRFFTTEIVWTDQEIILNGGGAQYTKEARFHQYKDLWWKKQQQMHTDNMNYWEEQFWRVPVVAEQETATGQEMYSIPTFINEATNGLFNPLTSTVFTTVQKIDPVLAGQTAWKNQVFAYGAAGAGFTVNSTENVISYLDRATHALDFRPPPLHKEYWESPTARPTGFIACSLTGKIRLMALFRASNDRWTDLTDPWMSPTYNGSAIVYVRELDTAALYADVAGTALVSESGTPNLLGPRYYLINPQYLRPVFHSERYMENLGEMHDLEQPTTHVQPIDTWANLVCRSRQRHAILTPSADNA